MIRKRILCVDDHFDTCDLLQVIFSEHQVEVAQSASKALHLARASLWDLYLLDTWMPGYDGIELCRRIRAFDLNTPILFFSAAAYESDRQRAIEAGAQEYVTKPADPQFLKVRVERLLRQAELRDLEAKVAEMAAISEQQQQTQFLIPNSARYLTSSEIEVLREVGQQTFVAAGGTRASFERFWSNLVTTFLQTSTRQTFLDAVESVDLS